MVGAVVQPLRVLAVSAHPDDIEFSCSGSIARWVDEGAEVTYCIVTDGSTGTAEAELAGDKLAEIRREESVTAAGLVGVEEVIFLGYRDGYVEHTLELRRDIARVFRRARPHRLMALDPAPIPGGWFINHPDHRAVGQASLDICVTAGTTPGHFPELLDEGLEPFEVPNVWIPTYEGEADTFVDITDTIEVKIQALRCHESQIGESPVDDWIRTRARERAVGQSFEYAEAFRTFVLKEPDEDQR